VTVTCAGPNRHSWTYVGASLDVGVQFILPPGLALGASMGGHYRAAVAGRLDESVMPFGWDLSHGSGFRPRLRLWLGFAFV
jgi:hypothetical protein